MSEIKPRDLYVNYNQIMKYLADNNIKNGIWIAEIGKGTGFNVITTTEDMKPTKVTLEEVLKMEWLGFSNLKNMFKALNIEIEYSNTKFYDLDAIQKDGVKHLELKLHWTNLMSESEMDVKFRKLTTENWSSIESQLGDCFPVYNKWASDKVLVYHSCPDKFTFKSVITGFYGPRGSKPNNNEVIVDYIAKGGDFDKLVFGLSIDLISLRKTIMQLIIDRCQKQAKIIEDLKNMLNP